MIVEKTPHGSLPFLPLRPFHFVEGQGEAAGAFASTSRRTPGLRARTCSNLFLVVDSPEKKPLERTKPYFRFFSERIDIALNVVTALEEEAGIFEERLAGSIVLYGRPLTSGP